MILPILGEDPADFPPVHRALKEPEGLLAMGGDLSPARLIHAYRRGIFPWFSEGDPIFWWSPDPRTVFTPENFHVSRSLAKWRRQRRYRVTVDQNFAGVLDGCAAPRPDQAGTWILPEMRAAFMGLHRLRIAHSVEIWDGSELVGGVFGVRIGRAAFGESMFSRRPNASKLALSAILVDGCWGEIDFLDCQFTTEHLLSLGAEEWSRRRFVQRLAEAIEAPTTPSD